MARAKGILEELSADPQMQEMAREREEYLREQHIWLASAKHEGLFEGKANGKAGAILIVLRTRGLVVSPEVEQRVQCCNDVWRLDQWLRRAVVVASSEEIFGEAAAAAQSAGEASFAESD